MKKRSRLLTVLLALVFTLTSVQLTFAADVSDNFDKKTPNIAANTLVSGIFESNNDSDTYTFISGGGSYNLVVYTKTPIAHPYAMDEEDVVTPFGFDYGKFGKFAAAGGDKERFQMGSFLTDPFVSVAPDGSGWYVGTESLGSFRKDSKVGISFDTSKTGPYMFKVVGANSPAAGKTVLKSAKGKKKAAVVKWKKSAGASGYQIQYSKDQNFKSGVKTVTVKKGSTLSKTVKIKKKGRYYFRVRAYKKITDVKVYGSWSKVKSGKVK